MEPDSHQQKQFFGVLNPLFRRVSTVVCRRRTQRLFVYVAGVLFMLYLLFPLSNSENQLQKSSRQPVTAEVQTVQPELVSESRPPAKREAGKVNKNRPPVKKKGSKKPAKRKLSQALVTAVQAVEEVKAVPAMQTDNPQYLHTVEPGPTLPDYIKLDGGGHELLVNAPEWTCVKDSANGLVWENKTANGGLQDKDHSFSWYQTRQDPYNQEVMIINGVAGGGRCTGGIACDTQSYVREMNTRKLCGYSDWRLPTREELLTLVTFQNNKGGASIDSEYFPNGIASWYWTASSNEERNEYAWYVLFRNGVPLNDLKRRPKHIRLVRSVEPVSDGEQELASK